MYSWLQKSRFIFFALSLMAALAIGCGDDNPSGPEDNGGEVNSGDNNDGGNNDGGNNDGGNNDGGNNDGGNNDGGNNGGDNDGGDNDDGDNGGGDNGGDNDGGDNDGGNIEELDPDEFAACGEEEQAYILPVLQGISPVQAQAILLLTQGGGTETISSPNGGSITITVNVDEGGGLGGLTATGTWEGTVTDVVTEEDGPRLSGIAAGNISLTSGLEFVFEGEFSGNMSGPVKVQVSAGGTTIFLLEPKSCVLDISAGLDDLDN